MTAAGNPEKVDKAKKILINATIGLIIILTSYAIASFIINIITGGRPGGGGEVPPYGGGGGALGNGIIQSHYPARNAVGIPRNTSIVITFKEPMDMATLTTTTAQGTEINADNVIIYQSDDRSVFDPNEIPHKETQVTSAGASITPDNKTVVYKSNQYLGSPDQNTKYKVLLTNSIKKQNGQLAFGNLGGYEWEFEVSTIIDVTPPKIISVIPVPEGNYPRNVVIQINFSEPINPITIGGKVTINGGGTLGSALTLNSYNFINVKTNDAVPLYVAGEFYYSNQYRTTEFITIDLCGKNSCGNDVFCLPGPKDLSVLVKAAEIGSIDPAAPNDPRFAIYPYTGIVDMADNSLDGNRNNTADGPTYNSLPYDIGSPDPAKGDNAIWNFKTTSEIRLVPPQITEYAPGADDIGVNPLNTNPITIDFDSILMSSTVKPDSNYGDNQDYIGLIFPDNLEELGFPGGGWAYWLESKNLPEITEPKSSTQAIINHATLGENIDIKVKVGSGVKDIYQNCYNPCSGPDCERQETSIPGQYIEGGVWSGQFPSCDLTQ